MLHTDHVYTTFTRYLLIKLLLRLLRFYDLKYEELPMNKKIT